MDRPLSTLHTLSHTHLWYLPGTWHPGTASSWCVTTHCYQCLSHTLTLPVCNQCLSHTLTHPVCVLPCVSRVPHSLTACLHPNHLMSTYTYYTCCSHTLPTPHISASTRYLPLSGYLPTVSSSSSIHISVTGHLFAFQYRLVLH